MENDTEGGTVVAAGAKTAKQCNMISSTQRKRTNEADNDKQTQSLVEIIRNYLVQKKKSKIDESYVGRLRYLQTKQEHKNNTKTEVKQENKSKSQTEYCSTWHGWRRHIVLRLVGDSEIKLVSIYLYIDFLRCCYFFVVAQRLKTYNNIAEWMNTE